MKHNMTTWQVTALACMGLAWAAAGAQTDFDAELRSVRDNWAIAKYRTPEDQKLAAFKKLMTQSAAFADKYPDRPEALIWDGIVLSTYAGLKGGFGAMGPSKRARARFEAAVAIDDTAMDAAAYTSLGVLYHKVPGFPFAFGSDRKARAFFEKALQISPDAIDANYFYGEFLYDNGKYPQALAHLEKALEAPPRPGRDLADEGRRAEIRTLIAKTKKKLD